MKALCSVENCGKHVLAKGLCVTHYHRAKEGRPLTPLPRVTTCSVLSCGRPIDGNGLCKMHNTRMKRHGDPLVTLRAPKHEPWRYYQNDLPAIETDECIIWPYARDNNGRALLARPGTNAGNVYVCRLICTAQYGEPPTSEYQAAHSCGNGHLGCVNYRHLSWKTPIANNADKITHGTNGRKLSATDVLELRRLKGTATAKELGRRFGVSPGAARAAYNRKSWRFLP